MVGARGSDAAVAAPGDWRGGAGADVGAVRWREKGIGRGSAEKPNSIHNSI